MNNREAFEAMMRKTFGEKVNLNRMQTITGEKSDEYRSPSVRDCLALFSVIASQAQQPTDLSKQLREYAADSGYSHNDYADTMLAAAYEIERCAARLAASQAQQEPEVCSDGGKCGAGGYCITCPNVPAPEGDQP